MTRQSAIDAKCKDCLYDPGCGKGTWKEQIAQCMSTTCPLWPYRPAPRGGQWFDPPRDPSRIPPEWQEKIARGDAAALHRSGN